MVRHDARRMLGGRPAARLAASLIAAVALLLAGAGCGAKPQWNAPGQKQPDQAKPPAVQLAISNPADGATNVATSTEINYTTDAVSSAVQLTDAGGGQVDGALQPDSSTWMPAKQLKWATQYTAKITGTNAKGESESKTVSFTTMAKPGSLARVSSMFGDGQVVGVGMPVIVTFGVDVAKDQRAAVQKRMFVTSTPSQEGAWNWFNAHEVHFRPKAYWQPGTTLQVRLATGGLPIGGKWYGAADVNVKATVGPKILMVADNATKQMTVTRDGQVLRTIPVSFGKSSTPTSSGNFIVMIKNKSEWFDSSTFGIPAGASGGYRTLVYWTQRLTWDGEYIHSAPWSVGDQGRRNVSHGCTNVSPANAEWLYNQTHIGDPVIIKGTEDRVKWGNGWTDWEMSFDQYVKGSAVPYVAPSTQPSVPASPEPTPSHS
jgi:lipoprotein-anchoring transpeptidase ErfK/SrfK